MMTDVKISLHCQIKLIGYVGAFKPPPPVGAGGGYVFGSSVRAAVHACVRP